MAWQHHEINWRRTHRLYTGPPWTEMIPPIDPGTTQLQQKDYKKAVRRPQNGMQHHE